MKSIEQQLKRERFLPYAYERFGIGCSVRRCELDGSRVGAELDQCASLALQLPNP
jgi:hypothetical protein